MTESRFELRSVTKKFGKATALEDVSLSVTGKSIIGLVGKNGSGKTTLLRQITGLYLPTSGRCETFGVPTDKLGPGELSRIGAVQQDDIFPEWMKIRQLLGYVSHFYTQWDKELEQHLLDTLELDENQRVGTLSPGNKQKLSLIIATCHHPALLLLDEPLSDLDPIARQDVLESLLDQFRSDDVTIVISSHMLPELERIADRVVFLDRGRIIVDEDLDVLKEGYAEWVVSSKAGALPGEFGEEFVISAEGDRHRARLVVSDSPGLAEQFANRYSAEVEVRPLNLERIFALRGRRAGQ
ncbi:MAG: ABC transporter ATP-binding protein [Gemmatimonadaceae bacterium]|nr:ABC transporter ATP-binding protein [Gemmatimonadaceae bacterium]